MFAQTKSQAAFLVNRSLAQNALIVLFASIVLSLVSKVFIPWQPVPMTFESVTVILFGLTLGSKRATAAVGLYLLQGGLGVWTAGFSVLAGPTAGFILGFLPAAFFAGWMMESGMARGFIRTLITAVLSTLIVFSCGATWLQAIIGWHDAYLYGIKPFFIVEPIKLLVASAFVMVCQKTTSKKHDH